MWLLTKTFSVFRLFFDSAGFLFWSGWLWLTWAAADVLRKAIASALIRDEVIVLPLFLSRTPRHIFAAPSPRDRHEMRRVLVFLPKWHGDLLLPCYDALIQSKTFPLRFTFPAIIGSRMLHFLFFYERIAARWGDHDRRLKIQRIFPLSWSLSPQMCQIIPLSQQFLLILLHILHQQLPSQIPSCYFLNLHSCTMLHIVLFPLLPPDLLQ